MPNADACERSHASRLIGIVARNLVVCDPVSAVGGAGGSSGVAVGVANAPDASRRPRRLREEGVASASCIASM